MCGICGEIDFTGRAVSAARLERMAGAMAPRGPDGAGLVVRGPFGFAHRRLKIICREERVLDDERVGALCDRERRTPAGSHVARAEPGIAGRGDRPLRRAGCVDRPGP